MNKKNIVFFLPNFSYGGAGKSILNICKNLSKKKYDIFVISLNKNYYKKYKPNFEILSNIKYYISTINTEHFTVLPMHLCI